MIEFSHPAWASSIISNYLVNRDSWKFILDRVAKRACPLLNAQFDLLEVILLKTATEVALSILPLVLIGFENTKFSMFAAI